MNEFDKKAGEWDKNPVHHERSISIAEGIAGSLRFTPDMRAMEYGAGTALLSFLLQDHFREIVLIDSSSEMTRMANEKIQSAGITKMKALHFDLEQHELKNENFDFIMTQMVLHHVMDVEGIIKKFYALLKPGGYLAIADLYPEDGSFHDEGFTGHHGFDVDQLAATLRKAGFSEINVRKQFTIRWNLDNAGSKEYPVFLMTSLKK